MQHTTTIQPVFAGKRILQSQQPHNPVRVSQVAIVRFVKSLRLNPLLTRPKNGKQRRNGVKL